MEEFEKTKYELLGSLLLFTQTFYKLRTGRDFELSAPVGRESHFITISKELTKVFRGEIQKLCLFVPPRYGKTENAISFIAWTLAHFPDSEYIYTSYSHTLATKQTQAIKELIQLPHYRKLFNVEIARDSSAKADFKTTQGGKVYAAGSGGTVTGMGAGIKGVSRWGGAFFMDDLHKPDESTSDTVREGVKEWFFNTAQSRINAPHTPFIYIGHKTHEDDLPSNLEKMGWHVVSLPALDAAGNALYPEMHPKEALLKLKEESPYVFAAQYQQDPIPAGGSVFKEDNFFLTDEDPDCLATFITIDTAETEKDYNDATVFSFWGLHKINQFGVDTEVYGLHWIDCIEIRVEPKDLQAEFLAFYSLCMQYKIKPRFAAIEKKSTGVTLLSVLGSFQGLQVLDSQSSGENYSRRKSKTDRFLDIQPYVSKKLISLPRYGRHTKMCIEHCKKITANNSHRFDDIADTLYDAIKIALIDKILINISQSNKKTVAKSAMANMVRRQKQLQQLRA